MAKKQKQTKIVVKKTKPKRALFGPVSTINSAPVSVGNSVRGSSPVVNQTTDGARVIGRDFAFSLAGTASAVTNWELIGGMPITPCCLPSSILRNYCQMFNKFRVNKVIVHYITSSPTSQAGDVLFYYEKDRLAPMADYSSSSFLPYVLSDPHTVIGPQWTNHSAVIRPTKDWKTTLYGNQSDLNEDAEGTVFFFSKTNSANSPGYLLIDYDIQFKELSVNPRAGSLPVARAQSSFLCLTNGAASAAVGSVPNWSMVLGKNVGGLTSATPTGGVPGDVYKVVLQVTASQLVNPAWTGTPFPTVANLFRYGVSNRSLVIDDGTTLYGVSDGPFLVLYSTLEGAITASDPLELATGFTATYSINICAEVQLVRNITDFTQSAY